MALILADRVKQESTTTGTGAIAFSGGVDGFQLFSAVCSTNDTMYYVIQDKIGTNFEIGHGTFNASGQIERTNILQSSNSDNVVNFGAGTKEVFITYPADKAIFQNFDGSITIPSTIDGRDLVNDGAKLDNIENSATADQTASEIRSLVESASDSNVFTDADHSKLNAIEASATADQTDAEIRTAVEAASDSNVFTDADHTKLNAIEASATADQTNDEIKAAVEAASDSNTFTDADHTKLNGIETSATADQTKSEIEALNINADTLDGQHGSYYTSYADTAVSNLVDSSPSALNTLNELAAAIGDDANFSTTITNSIASTNTTANAALPKAGGTITGQLIVNNDLKLPDNSELRIGSATNGDFLIYHDSSNSYIQDTGTGDLYVDSTGSAVYVRGATVVGLQKYTGENCVLANADGSVDLYHDNSKKFETNANGCQITGTVSATTASLSTVNATNANIGGMTIASNGLSCNGTLNCNLVTAGTLSGVLQNGQRFENGAWYDSNEGKERFYFYNNGSSLWNTADAHLFQHNGSTKFTVDSGGNCTAVGNITAYSSRKLKSDIKTIDNALDKVSQMRGVTFTKDGELSSGVIAEEFEEVAPELVMDGEYKSVAYGNTIGYLIEAIKELKQEINSIKKCSCGTPTEYNGVKIDEVT